MSERPTAAGRAAAVTTAKKAAEDAKAAYTTFCTGLKAAVDTTDKALKPANAAAATNTTTVVGTTDGTTDERLVGGRRFRRRGRRPAMPSAPAPSSALTLPL